MVKELFSPFHIIKDPVQNIKFINKKSCNGKHLVLAQNSFIPVVSLE